MPERLIRPNRRTLLRALAVGSVLLLPEGRRLALGQWRPQPAQARNDATERQAVIGDRETWADVDVTLNIARGMVGDDVVWESLVTTGKPGWETPEGHFRIVRRVYNETMTSASLGITDPNDQYVLRDVLYTQYFTWVGHALHLNYWRPDYVFGNESTSHGCVGMRLRDAERFWNHLGIGSWVIVHA